MNKIIFSAVMVILPLVLPADVIMDLSMPRACYMLHEPVLAQLGLRNTSGQALIFGEEAEFKGFLEVEISNMHGKPLPGSGTRIQLKGMILRPGANHYIRVNLSKWLNLNRVGFFKLKFYISHPMLKHEYQSNTTSFDISHGRVFWSRSFGVPQLEGGAKLGEDLQLRSYTVRTMQDKADTKLFLFVEDKEYIYSMRQIGAFLGREIPQFELDALNNLHMLLPITPKLFRYMKFDWNGKRELNKLYRTAANVPVLYRDTTNGEVKVIGGDIARAGTDYESEKLLNDDPAAETSRVRTPQKNTAESNLTPVAPPAKK